MSQGGAITYESETELSGTPSTESSSDQTSQLPKDTEVGIDGSEVPEFVDTTRTTTPPLTAPDRHGSFAPEPSSWPKTTPPKTSRKPWSTEICCRCFAPNTPEKPCHSSAEKCKAADRKIAIRNFEAHTLAKKGNLAPGSDLWANGILGDETYQEKGSLANAFAIPNTAEAADDFDRILKILKCPIDTKAVSEEPNAKYVNVVGNSREAHDVFAFASNYKVEGIFAIISVEAYAAIMALDTGAGPNCVPEKSLPPKWNERLLYKRSASILAADNRVIKTHGFLNLWIRLGDYVVRDEFLVCDEFPDPILLGTRFIDRNVR